MNGTLMAQPANGGQSATSVQKTREAGFITVPELAAILRVPVSCVYEWTRRSGPESIPSYKAGKRLVFDQAEVLAWFKETQRRGTSLFPLERGRRFRRPRKRRRFVRKDHAVAAVLPNPMPEGASRW